MSNYAKASEAHFTAMKLEAEAVLETYFNNSVGIGEHSDIPAEVNKWVERLSTAEDALKTLVRYTIPNPAKTEVKVV